MVDSNFEMRSPCKYGCDTRSGFIVPKNGQDLVYCVLCKKWQYCVPKTESGRAVRSVKTTHDAINPKLRAKVLTRANGHCELCGKPFSECVGHVGHLVSVDHGHAAGLTDQEINDLENLCAMCDECNLGLGNEPATLRFCLMVLKARIRFVGGRNAN